MCRSRVRVVSQCGQVTLSAGHVLWCSYYRVGLKEEVVSKRKISFKLNATTVRHEEAHLPRAETFELWHDTSNNQPAYTDSSPYAPINPSSTASSDTPPPDTTSRYTHSHPSSVFPAGSVDRYGCSRGPCVGSRQVARRRVGRGRLLRRVRRGRWGFDRVGSRG